MFKRLHNKEQFGNQGSGISLAIVKLIVDELDGAVQIESTLNKGTTFILALPKE